MPTFQNLAAAARLFGQLLRTGPPPPITTAARLTNIPLRAAALQNPVEIAWDAHQVPSITARNERDLAFGLGVVHAHLRLAQMEAMRRLATGRVAELIGPAAIELDRALRLMRFGPAIPAMLAAMPPSTRRWAEGFVAGVNHQIAGAPELPYEFRLLRLSPEPWTLEHLLLISRLAATDVSWLVFAKLLGAQARLSPAAWQTLWPLLQNGDTLPLPSNATEAALGLVRGSNSAAVSARRSATGAGMIASDPHLPITLPPLWLIAGLHAPGLDVVGLMIPGLPVTALGRNRALAWGGTSLHAASSELIDVSAETLTTHTETIQVRGRPAITVPFRESRFGPVVSDGILLRARQPLALRWVGHAASDELTAMLGVMRAETIEAFRTALRPFAVPGQTMVAVEAGPGGRAASVMAAHLPRRPAAPLAGPVCSPAAAWPLDNLVIAADLPHPTADIIASANDRPAAAPVPVGFFFSPPDRVRRLRALLNTAAPITPERMRALQLDVAQPSALSLRNTLLQRLQPKPRQRKAAQILAEWNGAYEEHSAGALVFEITVGALARQLIPKTELALLSSLWSGRALIAQRLATASPRHMNAALRAAARALRRHGNWGQIHRLSIRHPLAAFPMIGHWFAPLDLPAAGSNETLNKTAHGLVTARHRATYGACARHVSDLSHLNNNWFVLLGGQDGWLGSANATDQIALWRAGQSIQLPLEPEAARAAAAHITVLTP